MHIEELQRIALRLANNGFARWFAHFNHPQQNPWLMAIGVFDHSDRFQDLDKAMEERGFTVGRGPRAHGFRTHTIPRTDEQGQPFTSNL